MGDHLMGDQLMQLWLYDRANIIEKYILPLETHDGLGTADRVTLLLRMINDEDEDDIDIEGDGDDKSCLYIYENTISYSFSKVSVAEV